MPVWNRCRACPLCAQASSLRIIKSTPMWNWLVLSPQRIVAEGVLDALAQGTALRLELPVLEIPSVPTDTDVLFDAYVDLAFNAFDWIHRQFGGPALPEASGELGRLSAFRR